MPSSHQDMSCSHQDMSCSHEDFQNSSNELHNSVITERDGGDTPGGSAELKPIGIRKTGGAKRMDMDGDEAVSSHEYPNYVSKDRYELDVVDVLDENRDGMQEYLNERLMCHDAGTTNELCCKCYGDKTYEHLDDHTCFTDVHGLIQLRKPKPGSQSQGIFKVTPSTLHTAKMVANLAAGSPLCTIM
ncbi:hypothetical protein RHSIM_RhsimUnG0058000 [Rhododendron simsii]|uniref:Uncharacterized protein n=1 Tax=Rhododendron simsii TaxID=118357 RepID=A0A834FWH5_RHOSS|nr:hypothetical protein RHSIM_RhsimUnG0058000 [Rhododendron simsii]